MRKISIWALQAIVLLSACKPSFKKADNGLEYKIIPEGSGPLVKSGDYMQVNIAQFYYDGKKDSLMNDSRTTTGPIIQPLDSASMPPAYFKVLSQLKKGDSLVLRLLVDSMFASNPQSMPPYFKKGNYFITTARLINIFKTKEQVDSATKAEYAIAQRRDSINNIPIFAAEDKKLQAYFKQNNIKATKAPLGTYVEILQPGTGPLINDSVSVKTNYTGRTMNGKMFDSNTDSSKGHVEPFTVSMSNGGVIKGWLDGLKLLNKGAKAKFYIPSPLAYGKNAMGNDIPANSILIFDIEVLDVMTKAQADADQKEIIRKFREKQLKDAGKTGEKGTQTPSADKKP